MRWLIIINPPAYRQNDEDEGGFAWAGEAATEAEAFEAACDACEESNGWGHYSEDPDMAEHSAIDRLDTHTIEAGPDHAHTMELLRPILDEMLAYQAAQFDGAPDVDLSVSGSDLVDAFTSWRERLRAALA